MRLATLFAIAFIVTLSVPASATVFATVHGVVHDPQHRPVAGAQVMLKAIDSAFSLHSATGNDGEFALPEAALGLYNLEVEAKGFADFSEAIAVSSGTNPLVHIALEVGS